MENTDKIRRQNMATTPRDGSLSDTKKADIMPDLIGRSAVEQYFPGILRGKTLANLARQGRGPRAYRIGRRVYYKYTELLQWVEANSVPILSIDAPQ
jgi:hypothetical protein